MRCVHTKFLNHGTIAKHCLWCQFISAIYDIRCEMFRTNVVDVCVCVRHRFNRVKIAERWTCPTSTPGCHLLFFLSFQQNEYGCCNVSNKYFSSECWTHFNSRTNFVVKLTAEKLCVCVCVSLWNALWNVWPFVHRHCMLFDACLFIILSYTSLILYFLLLLQQCSLISC